MLVIAELFIKSLICTNRKDIKQKKFVFAITENTSHSPQVFQAPSQGLGENSATPMVAFMFLTGLT